MTKKRELTIPDIARDTGYTRQQMFTWHKKGKIPFKPAKWGGKQVRYHNSPELRAWMKKVAEQKANPLPTMTRAQRISQRRAEKIEKLCAIFNNKTEVKTDEKEAAIYFCLCLEKVSRRKSVQERYPFPLIEGIWALYKTNRLFYDDNLDWVLDDLIEKIESLPTRPKTTPQNGQSSLNASD
jgi:predicted DNA-binding transcriptional regulator AlpA